MRLIAVSILFCLATLALGAEPLRRPISKPTGEITVSAASSLQESLTEVAHLFEAEAKERVVLNFGASGALAQQIANGAPVDVFISAAEKPIDDLEKIGNVLPGTRQIVARNVLVLVAPVGQSQLQAFADLSQETVKKIAIGEPATVPAGQYAMETFASLKLLDRVASKLIFGQSVRQVLTYVETANVDAGVVYATDAMSSKKVRVVAEADAKSHAAIVYPAAVLKASKKIDVAKRFATFLVSSEAQAIFIRHGFKAGASAS